VSTAATAEAILAPASTKTRILHSISRRGGPLSTPLAATGWIGVWGILEHVGRKSGRRYRIPVAVLKTAGGFLVPVPFGDATQWARNVLVAGGCTIRWHGRDYATAHAAIVDLAAVRSEINGILRVLVPIVGIREFMRLTVV
jgi:hypothetical protein